ncbi:unnamed protein product [Linum trigynum]|uniref:Uncharacterized protein n=1 Tax=Linum trigynum TaxID=586398 RepID=A0AAV2D7J3_9ROSI
MLRVALASLLCLCRLLGRLLFVAVQEFLTASIQNQAQGWFKKGTPSDQAIKPSFYPSRDEPGNGIDSSGWRDKQYSQSRSLKRKPGIYMAECDINHSCKKKNRNTLRKMMWRFKLPSSDELECTDMVCIPSYQSTRDPPKESPMGVPMDNPPLHRLLVP